MDLNCLAVPRTLTLSPDSQRSVHETVNVFFIQGVLCRNITYMDYSLYLSKVLEYISFIAVDVKCTSNGHETAVRTAPAHKSSSGIIVNT